MNVECAHEDSAEAEIVSNEVPVPLPNHSIFGNSSPSPLQPDSFNYFSRPHDAFLESFFKYHPCQPVLDSDLPFNRKVFCGKNELKREWLTYSTIKKALFCSCCLAFGKDREKSSFEQGMKDWRHVFQRVVEHEKVTNTATVLKRMIAIRSQMIFLDCWVRLFYYSGKIRSMSGERFW